MTVFDDRNPDGGEAADATRQAQEVVGLYGDPDVTWGISLETTFVDQVDLGDVDGRLVDLVRDYPHLGVAPLVETVATEQWQERREESATADFGADGRLVRVLVREDRKAFFVTVHHGVCDGMGMVALTSAVTGRTIVSSARGVGERNARRGFLVSSVLRLGEALFTPPARFSGTRGGSGADCLLKVDAVPGRVNGAIASAAVLAVHGSWPRNRSAGGRRFLAVMGASRREPGTSAPDRQTAYLRVPLRPGDGVAEVEAAIAAADPEPDVPETSAGGIGPVVMRVLKNRLGYTANVSNLGVLSGPGLESLVIYPALNGPQAVGVGLGSTEFGATVSVRTRRTDFTDAETAALLRAIVEQVRRLGTV